ncbi:MAG: hypothetical protein LBL04_06970 [Bacteroidales bacterium]|jgi:hypothetical protein|nr:hypothetical protein [Bacteroidales bacterium]
MKRVNLKIRFWVVLATVLSASFASCEKDDPNPPAEIEVDGVTIPDADYYSNNENALQIALRNVRMKWIVKDEMLDNADGTLAPDEYGEVMICKGRQWSKGHYNDYRDDPVFKEQWYAYDPDGILRAYNFIKHEKYAID